MRSVRRSVAGGRGTQVGLAGNNLILLLLDAWRFFHFRLDLKLIRLLFSTKREEKEENSNRIARAHAQADKGGGHESRREKGAMLGQVLDDDDQGERSAVAFLWPRTGPHGTQASRDGNATSTSLAASAQSHGRRWGRGN